MEAGRDRAAEGAAADGFAAATTAGCGWMLPESSVARAWMVAVPVAVVDPLGGSNTVFGAANGVGLGGEDLVDKPLQHLAHQIRGGLGEQIIQIGCRVDRIRCSGHRHRPFGEMW